MVDELLYALFLVELSDLDALGDQVLVDHFIQRLVRGLLAIFNLLLAILDLR